MALSAFLDLQHDPSVRVWARLAPSAFRAVRRPVTR